MSKMSKIARMIAAFGYEGVDHLFGTKGMSSYGSKQGRHKQKRMRNKDGLIHKPASSYGFRGSPRTAVPCGSIPAPTIDQVRRIEQAYMIKIDVHHGIMYFKNEITAFTHEEAKNRRHEQLHTMFAACN